MALDMAVVFIGAKGALTLEKLVLWKNLKVHYSNINRVEISQTYYQYQMTCNQDGSSL